MRGLMAFEIEDSPLGRVVVAPSVPNGYAVFYTTEDFPGRLTNDIAHSIIAFVVDRFGIAASLTTCHQVHSATVVRTQHEERWREVEKCDALWSADSHVALGIKVADCLPITMIDPAHETIANVHSGWRGTVQHIAAETIDAMQRATAFDPAGSYAWLGPSIRACCFEVGEEVVERFAASFPDIDRYVDRSRPKPHIDVPALTTGVLLERGFPPARIFDSQICTRCEGSMFHSYRRGRKDGGRNLAFVAH